MRGIGAIGALALLAGVLAGCKQGSDAAAGEALAVRSTMMQQVNPATLAIWDIGNNAMTDLGGLDTAKLDAAKWDSLAEHAGKLGEAARAMAGAGSLKAAAPGDTAVAEGEVPMEAVQKALDADPSGFKAAALTLQDHADKLAAAAKARDGKVAGDLVAGLDQVCEGCHMKYWYPDQP